MNQTGGEVDVGVIGLVLFATLILISLSVWALAIFVRKLIRRISRYPIEPTATSGVETPEVAETKNSEPPHKMVKYKYYRREFIMSKHEREFYTRLFRAVGRQYLIFPQVHLDKVLDHRVKYQYHDAAHKSIRNFSVDYVLCDTKFRIMCAIELDDSTHKQDRRQLRDQAVNQVFERANLPLIRIPLSSNISGYQLESIILERIGRVHS